MLSLPLLITEQQLLVTRGDFYPCRWL